VQILWDTKKIVNLYCIYISNKDCQLQCWRTNIRG